jgi:hypothetical protein
MPFYLTVKLASVNVPVLKDKQTVTESKCRQTHKTGLELSA